MNDDDLIENSDVAMFDYHSHSEIGPVKTDIGPKFMAMSTQHRPHIFASKKSASGWIASTQNSNFGQGEHLQFSLAKGSEIANSPPAVWRHNLFEPRVIENFGDVHSENE